MIILLMMILIMMMRLLLMLLTMISVLSVLDNWWQTETGHALTSTCLGLGHSLNPPKDVSGMAVPGEI